MRETGIVLWTVTAGTVFAVSLGSLCFDLGRREGRRDVAPTALHLANSRFMVASWYGPGFAGKKTASGSYFDPSDMTCANRSLPFGTRLLVGLRGKWVEVTVTDRGPVPKDRDLDLSEAAAKALGFTKPGVAAVHVIQLEDHP